MKREGNTALASGLQTLRPSAWGSTASTQPASEAPGHSATCWESMCGDSMQLEWDLRRQEISLFVRHREGGDANEPTIVCTLDAWLDRVAPADRLRLRTKLLSLSQRTTRSFETQFRVGLSDGRQQWMDLCAVVVRDEQARLQRVIGQLRTLDANDVCQASHALSPFHDSLTALPNRALFERCLASALECGVEENEYQIAILFVDLDRFKAINDRHGHLVGDAMLRAVAQRFSDCLRPDDVIARRDGDEFTILLRDICEPSDAATVADRLLNEIRWPLSVDGAELTISASVGIALGGAGLFVPDDLLRRADRAMYQAKARGGNCYVIATM